MRNHLGAPLPAGARRRGRAGAAACVAIVLATLLHAAPARAWELGIGRSSRAGDFDLSLRDAWWSLEAIDEGRQPDGIPDRNRVLDADLVLHGGARLCWYLQAGLSDARWSRNASGNGYRAPRGFDGHNLGGGLQWRLAPGWWLRLQTLWLRYPQNSQPGSESFEYTSLALVRRW